MDDCIDLNNNYRLIQDNPKAIIYNTDSISKSSGVNIVPPIVLIYDFNDKYIIAEFLETKKERITKVKLSHYYLLFLN